MRSSGTARCAVIYTANDYGDLWQFGLERAGAVRHAPGR